MTRPLPSHGAWVARPRSEVIPEGDGAPSTHTPPAATPDLKVTSNPPGDAPLPLAASSPARAELIPVLVITVVGLSMAAIPTWLVTSSGTVAGLIGLAVGTFVFLCALPAVLGYRNPVERIRRRGVVR